MSLMSYKCAHCTRSGVRLWREYQTFTVVLRCTACLPTEDRDKAVNDSKPWDPLSAVGWWVAAVPDGEDWWWGYTSIPADGLRWWRELPQG